MTGFEERSRRATALAERFPASAEILRFYAAVAAWQASHASSVARFEDLGPRLPSLADLVAETGPAPLADAARRLGPAPPDAWILEHWESPRPLSAEGFFARVLMQLYASTLPEAMDCPWCPAPPLTGCLTTQGDGQALHLVCALCFRRRPFMRAKCPACEEMEASRLVTYSTAEFPQLRLKACDSCKGYLLAVDLEKDLEAIPEVDEMAGLPLDVWAAETGYRKLQPNIAGI